MKKVAIYTTPTCTYCQMTKEFFKQNGVEYSEYDVAADVARRQEMVDKTGQMGVPVISVTEEDGEEHLIVGFDKGGLSAALGI